MTTAAVLFDLDGTLADTAPDLGSALNRLLAEEGRSPLPFEKIRRHASFGVKGLQTCGFGETPPGETERLTARFLELYRQNLCDKTRLFLSAKETLMALDERGVAWGVATNKSRYLAEPILKRLELLNAAHCLVCGDEVKRKKPAPDLMVLAAERLRVNTSDCLYIGDSERDAVAAKAAGMTVLIVAYGYESKDADTDTWNCDGVIEKLTDIIAWINPGAATQAKPKVSD